MIGFRCALVARMLRILGFWLAATVARVLVLVARVLAPGRHAPVLVKPETAPRWHREGFRLFGCAATR